MTDRYRVFNPIEISTAAALTFLNAIGYFNETLELVSVSHVFLTLDTLSYCLISYLTTYRHDKRLSFDTIGFLEDPKLTRKQRDSRQNIYGDKPKNQVFWSTNTSICTL